MPMKNPLLSIFLVVFIDLVGFGIVIPILPYYAIFFGASPATLGWLMMCYSAMQFLFSPFWGNLSDRIGRRPVILICITGICLSMAMLGLAKSLVGLFLARLLAGFFGANLSAASAYIADVTPPEKRAKGMGLIGAAFGLGFLVGPALGGFLSKWGYACPAFFAAGLALVNLFFAFFFLKEPPLSLETRSAHRSHFKPSTLKHILFGQAGLYIVLFFLVTLGMAQLETSFALFVLAKFGLGAFEAGLILAGMALVMVVVQGGFIGWLAKQFGEYRLALFGSLLMALALFGVTLGGAISLFCLFVGLHAVGYGLTHPSLSSLVSRLQAYDSQGTTMGIYQSAGSLARVFGPVLAGYLFENVGMNDPFRVASVFFSGVFIILVCKYRKIV